MEKHYGNSDDLEEGSGDPFRTLMECVLSHRTKDENAARAARSLLEGVEGPADILRLKPDELKERIRSSGFYNQKARNILGICKTLEEDFGGAVPDDRSKLMRLPGVGPKTADIVLSHAFNRPAIAVDVHVATVAKRLGLVGDKADPNRIKQELEELFPPRMYRFVDHAFVRHGKECCRARNPRCEDCFLRGACEHPGHRDDK
jgi:endonuclease-3